MNQTIQEKNKAFVLEAFDTLFKWNIAEPVPRIAFVLPIIARG